jgi:hypothetical protein
MADPSFSETACPNPNSAHVLPEPNPFIGKGGSCAALCILGRVARLWLVGYRQRTVVREGPPTP